MELLQLPMSAFYNDENRTAYYLKGLNNQIFKNSLSSLGFDIKTHKRHSNHLI